jgi:type IV pilus assembly protein PilB
MANIKKLRLGDMLVKAQIITEEQLRRALEVQKQTKEKLGTVLVNLGFVREKVMLGFLASQLGLKTVHLDEIEPVRLDYLDIREDVFVSLLEKYVVIPIADELDTLVLAMADPLDIEAIDIFERITSKRVKPVIATEREIREGIRIYRRMLR